MSNKRIREMFQKTLDEKTFFDFRFSFDGTLVKPVVESENEFVENSETDANFIDEEGTYYPLSETVRLVFDQKTKRSLEKTFRLILKKRGIAPLDSITMNLKEVRDAINSYGKNVDENTKERIRQEIVSKYEPEYNIALYECMCLALVEKDIFKLKRGASGIQAECRLDIDVSDDFWETQSPQYDDYTEEEIEFDEIKYGKHIENLKPIVRDKKDLVEWMIAAVDTLLLEYEHLAEVFKDLTSVAMANIYVSANREAVIAEGLEPFQRRLEELLPRYMAESNNNVQWFDSNGGVPLSFRKD